MLFVCLFEWDWIILNIFIESFDMMSNANYTCKCYGIWFHPASTEALIAWRPLLRLTPIFIPNPEPNLYNTLNPTDLRLL